ncbi:hypothetical protein [Paraburkholderia pallida]|uniref:Uncharacterized protein n=1 Tax=Paraburkholderia pallida TaxID=2547399 RepID=A0A4P7D5R3_9BURK|nr:hypothetical protein [Paraburkholderia pallida]QBR04161.1 hypothetical protein E1956_44280 [Paraburkholderia pallida]
MLDPVEERYACYVDGRVLTVVIRNGAGVTALSDFDTFSPDGNICVVVIHGASSVTDQLQKAIAEARDGDSILVYCPVSERHQAARRMLRIGQRNVAYAEA